MTTLEVREKELGIPSALRGLIEPGADVTHPVSWRTHEYPLRNRQPATEP